MLTRLKVEGFKNLDVVDIRFGPFTCVAGPNGVGKSNIFDAIAFLAALADKPLVEAALAVRGGDSRRGDVRSLFRRVGKQVSDHMKLSAEILISPNGEDSLGQPARASMTFLHYELELRYRPDPSIKGAGTLEVVRETMAHINRSAAKSRLGFPQKKAWRDSAVTGRRTSPYISTEMEDGSAVVSLHADSVGGMGGGRPRRVTAASLPRTMLSSVSNAAEHRTLVLAKQEMVGWTQLQLEPSALRAPDEFTAPRSVGPTGTHLPATLFALTQAAESASKGSGVDVLAQVANRLSELVEDVRRVRVDVDEKRQLMSIVMNDRQGTEHFAGALSDGTLRFLALTVMEADSRSGRLLCLEEPENGMHPLRIETVVQLLRDIAVDPEEPLDSGNPLRQVIVNTHSPSVVACVPDESLLMAQSSRCSWNGTDATRLVLRHLPGTWRGDQPEATISRGDILAYLNPMAALHEAGTEFEQHRTGGTRVIERPDLQMPLPLGVRETHEPS